MKIVKIDAFQIAWAPGDKPSQRSAFVRIHTDDGPIGNGEASPMQGGLASLSMIKHEIAPMLLDQAMHTLVKLGPEGALTGALAALDIALWDLKGKLTGLPS
jgi:L-alanine-DL-glutamate epimerase-like enolase superfamily enzyme